MLISSCDFWLHATGLSALAVLWAVVLVCDDKALLCPLIAWCRLAYRRRTGRELDEQRWWQPLWGCSKCIAAQWALWFYLIRHLHFGTHGIAAASYSLPDHLFFIAITTLFACLWRGLFSWTQQQP